MADRIVIDIGILQGIFGDLTRLQQQIGGIAPVVAGVDRAASQAFAGVGQSARGAQGAMSGLENGVDAGMRNIVADIMGPVAKTQELEAKLRSLGERVRTSKSVSEITKLKREIHATQRELDGVNPAAMEQKVGGAVGRMRSMFGGMVAPLAGAFAVSGIAAFANELARSAGAQQQFDASLKNMLQSKEKADALANQVKAFAATTPFELPEVQDATKKMLAFGFGAEETIPTLRRLGDVAAGLGQPVGDLAYLYGTTRVQGRLYTNDLMQFANRGIPIIEELSKVLGVSQSAVKEMVEKGKVGFPQVEQVFQNLTAEGSKFGGLMQAQSQTITGQISNLSDSWGQFKADMGLAMAPLITMIIGGMSGAIEVLRDTFSWVQANGPLIKGILLTIAIAVGIYSTALLINNASLIANNALQAVAAIRMGVLGGVMTLVTAATTVWTGVQWLLNAALTANPIGLVIAAIAALVAGVLYAWHNFEGFRGFLYGLWASVKETFGGMWDIISGIFDKLVTVGKGAANVLAAVFSNPLEAGYIDGITNAVGSYIDDITDLVKHVADVPNQVGQVAVNAKKAAMVGYVDGVNAAQADKASEAKKSPGLDATTFAAPGQNVGAAGLVGGSPAPPAGGATKGDGVTVGGSGGSGRTITMDIKMTNHFTLPKDGNMGAREMGERIVGELVKKLNDAQFAMG